MNQPTKEQIRWFWEQCGFRFSRTSPLQEFDDWVTFPDGKKGDISLTPSIDLNNLFQYAVPKGSCVSFTETGCDMTNCILTTPQLKIAQGKGESETLALFWAIYKAFGGRR